MMWIFMAYCTCMLVRPALASFLRGGESYSILPVSLRKQIQPPTQRMLSFGGRREEECANYCNDEGIRDQLVADICSIYVDNLFETFRDSLKDLYSYEAAGETCLDKESNCEEWYECISIYTCENPVDICNNEDDRDAMAEETCSGYEEDEYWSFDTLKEQYNSIPTTKSAGEACNNISTCRDWHSCIWKYTCENPDDICNDTNDRNVHIETICSVYNEFYTFESAKESLKGQYASTPGGEACNDKMSTCQEWQNCMVEWTCANPCAAAGFVSGDGGGGGDNGAGGTPDKDGVTRDGDDSTNNKKCWSPSRLRKCKHMCRNKINEARPIRKAKCIANCESKPLCAT